MQQLLSKIFQKQKLLILFFIVLTLFFIGLWIDSRYVSAQILPVSVVPNHLDFGTVFPGEEQEGGFTVYYATTSGAEVVTYRIVQKIKPLPDVLPPEGYELVSDYCQDYPNDLTKCYRNLCPYLEKLSVETSEGDTEELAYVGENDLSDAWTVYFKVPAIFGHVGQDHTGGVVDSAGEYGCDISIDIIE